MPKIHADIDGAVGLRLDPCHHRDSVGVVGPWRLGIVRAADDYPSMEYRVAPNDYFRLITHSSIPSLCHRTPRAGLRTQRAPVARG